MLDLEKDNVNIQPIQIPTYRLIHAKENGNLKRILMTVHGGLGDQVCAEPTLRYAIEQKKKGYVDKIALLSKIPELFDHLEFDEYFYDRPDFNQWHSFKTISDESGLECDFIAHNLMNCVDFPSICAFKMQLPTRDREIQISSTRPCDEISKLFENGYPTVIIHAGKHWPSKTFPKSWWDEIIDILVYNGVRPILIGADYDQNRTTVDVHKAGCIDLRNKTTVKELAWICQRATVLLTNDSSPLHMAASTDPLDYDGTGNCWIGFLATCKQADLITHWRKGRWQWRENNFSRGGVWDQNGFLLSRDTDTRIDKVTKSVLESWLPPTTEIAEWAMEKLHDI